MADAIDPFSCLQSFLAFGIQVYGFSMREINFAQRQKIEEDSKNRNPPLCLNCCELRLIWFDAIVGLLLLYTTTIGNRLSAIDLTSQEICFISKAYSHCPAYL